MFALKLAFAGAWSYVWHWGTGVGLIVLALALAYFTQAVPLIGPYLGRFRKDLCWFAVAVAVLLAGQYVGSEDCKARFAAQKLIVKERVNDVVDKVKSEPPPADGRAPRDKWDSPEN